MNTVGFTDWGKLLTLDAEKAKELVRQGNASTNFRRKLNGAKIILGRICSRDSAKWRPRGASSPRAIS
jgi:hypothetical protein